MKFDFIKQKDFQKDFLIYLTVFVTGAAVLIIEILGTRVLSPFYGSTIFVWSSLISVALGFLALGYYFGGRLADKEHSSFYFYLMILLAGISITGFYQFKRFIILFADSFGLQWGPLVASILFFGVPFLLLGTATPFAIRLISTNVQNSGTDSGKIFAIATLGSLGGAIAAGFFIIPLLSLSKIFYFTSLILIALSIFGIFISSNFKKLYSFKFAIIISIFILITSTGYALKEKDISELDLREHGFFRAQEILFEKDTLAANYKLVGVPRALDGLLCFLTSSTNQGCINPRSISSFPFHTFFVKVMEELSPKDADVLILGAGIGVFFYYGAPDFSYDIVDINPYTEEIWEIVGTKINPEKDRIIIDEARSYLINTDKKYDFIWNDLLGNAEPVTSLMTQEAYILKKERLKPNGVLLVHVVGESKEEDLIIANTVETIKSVFDNVLITEGYGGDHHDSIYILASDAPLPKDELNTIIVSSIIEKQGNRKDMSRWIFFEPEFEGNIVTDDYNLMEYLWAQNMKKYEEISEFRLRFKRISKNELIY